jgi:hypothetical protein
MRGAVSIIEFMLIAAVVVSLTGWSFPWISRIINEALDAGEVSAIIPQFKGCSEKILETARTGTTNNCIFSISRGEIKGRKEGIEYSIVSSAPVCEPHALTLIEKERHMYQSCESSGDSRIYKLIWMFPLELEIEGENIEGDHMEGETPIADIIFPSTINFITITLFVEFEYGEGEAGNTVELSRKSLSSDKIVMGVRVY